METQKLEFRFGIFGKLFPVLVAMAVIIWAAVSQSNVNGYVAAFFLAVIAGVLAAKDPKAYGEAVVKGLARPMFGVIVLAVILAAISGRLIAQSGVVQTIALFVQNIGFTGKPFCAATFLITCLLAFATGTSVGTYFVMFPILFPVGIMAGVDPTFMAGAIVSGAAFGDNLGPISDTTIASATTQGADLGNVVKTRMKYSIPAAVLALILFMVFTRANTGGIVIDGGAKVVSKPISLVMLLVPITIIVLCLLRKHLVVSLSYGIIVGIVASLIFGVYKLSALLRFPGGFAVEGHFIAGITGTMNTVAMLIAVFSLLGVLEASGQFQAIGNSLSKITKGPSSGEAAIIGSIGILSMLTGVISVAIVAMGNIVVTIGERVELDKYRRANLMDCSGIVFCFLAPWTVHCVIPAAQTAAFGEAAAVVPASIPLVNFYALSMAVILILMVLTGYGRVSKVKEPEETSTKA